MGDAIGRMLASAVGIAISPLPVVALIMMLSSSGPRRRTSVAAFAAGWSAALAVVVAAAILTASAVPHHGPHPRWARWAWLTLGLLLLLLAAWRWHDRPRTGHLHPPPSWMRTIARASPARSAPRAAALLLGDPKNLALAIGGGLAVGTATATGEGRAVAAVLMVLVGSLPLLLSCATDLLRRPLANPRPPRPFAEWRAWLAAHGSAVTLVTLLLLATQYLGEAISGLTT